MHFTIPESIDSGCMKEDWLADYCPQLSMLKNIPQDLAYHAEGDVYRHTEMVCEKLTGLCEWRALKKEEQELLFLAAAFHDVGKAFCTKQEEEKWVSPRHTIVGEKVFRRMAYREAEQFGLRFQQRETAAKLIRYHGLPVWFWTKERAEALLLKAAESVPLRLLYLLAKADVQGRITNEPGQMEDQVDMFADYAKELGVWEGPYAFANPYTKYQYFHKEGIWQGAQLYDDTEFDVILMSGLPLAGKDTWIEKYGMGSAVVSLDVIREQLGVPPAKKQGRVVQAALEQAKYFLRRKEPFIWNATNINEEIRQRLVSLSAGYGARVQIQYLEVPYRELLVRNQIRERDIPGNVLERMIQNMELPASWEAYGLKQEITDL